MILSFVKHNDPEVHHETRSRLGITTKKLLPNMII